MSEAESARLDGLGDWLRLQNLRSYLVVALELRLLSISRHVGPGPRSRRRPIFLGHRRQGPMSMLEGMFVELHIKDVLFLVFLQFQVGMLSAVMEFEYYNRNTM